MSFKIEYKEGSHGEAITLRKYCGVTIKSEREVPQLEISASGLPIRAKPKTKWFVIYPPGHHSHVEFTSLRESVQWIKEVQS